MAKLYGLGNYLMSEITVKLLNNKEFTKFVYYKDVSNKDILGLPDLDNPAIMLKNQIFRSRRTPKILEKQDVCVFMYLDNLRNYNEGLIALTGGTSGPIGRLLLENRKKEAIDTLINLKDIFNDRLYMEISRIGTQEEQKTEEDFINFAY